jgi:hypothetical protein
LATKINFGSDGKVVFHTKYHGDVTLSKAKWDVICEKPERQHYPFNVDKIATTLVNPDFVRHHRIEATQFFYYKQFPSINLSDTVTIHPPTSVWFAVIVDSSTSRVCTMFPVAHPKTGKQFKP